jgi:hypothetical protein
MADFTKGFAFAVIALLIIKIGAEILFAAGNM